MNDVEIAEKTVATLTDKRDRAAARVTAIAEERKAIGFAVHADNDKAARKRLDQLNADDAAMAGELQSLDAALVEAQARLGQAQQQAAEAAAKANAIELQKAVTEFRECATDLDAMLADLVECSSAMKTAVDRIHALGSPFPSHEQVHALGKFCF